MPLEWAVVFGVSLFIKISYVAYAGIGLSIDTPRYWAMARASPAVTPGSPSFHYLGYPLILSFFMKILPPHWVGWAAIWTQVALGAVSCVFLYHAILLLTSQKRIGLIFALYYCASFEVLYWDHYILTDSFNLSLMVASGAWMIAFFTAKDSPSWPALSGVALLSIYLFFTRPTDIVFILINGIFILYYFIRRLSFKMKLGTLLVSAVVFCALTIGFYQRVQLTDHIRGMILSRIEAGQVIEDDAATKIPLTFAWESASSSKKIAFAGKLLAKRLAYFWAIFPGRYSSAHKIYNALWLLPLWVAGLGSLLYALWRKRDRVTIYLIAIILGYNVFHALTLIDFDFRFRIVTIPFLLMLIASCYADLRVRRSRVPA